MKLLVALSCLLAIAQGLNIQRVDDGQCDGTECPAGCCPEANWYCCPDYMGPGCAASPAGCCPEVNWYCCPDNLYCAATAADCPIVAAKAQLVKMAAKKQCDGTPCPAGCCPEVNWYCCPDDLYCAATAADCPFVAAKAKLVKMAAKKQCDGTPC